MLPRLVAQESLRRASEVSVGTGALKEDNAKALLREWQRTATPRRPARKATARDLESLPIRIRRVPKKEPSLVGKPRKGSP